MRAGEGVLRTSYGINRVTAQVVARASSVLVQSDASAPGWRVYVNGQEREFARANTLFRAVQVPAGSSRVAWVYEPQSIRLGVFLSLCALGLVAGIWLGTRRGT
jgi:uncharacterized membrane protein YfhO